MHRIKIVGWEAPKAQDGQTVDPNTQLQENFQKGKDFLKNWYEGRATLPQFTNVANARLKEIDKFTYGVKPYSQMEGDAGKYVGGTSIQVTDSNDVNTPTGQPIITSPEVFSHEITHGLQRENPQINRDINFRPLPIKKSGLSKDKYNWINTVAPVKYIKPNGEPTNRYKPYFGTETEGALVMLRQVEKLDPTKTYTEEELIPIIDKYKNMSDDELKQNHNARIIKVMMQNVGFDPKKILEFQNKIVSNAPSSSNVAKYGGLTKYGPGGETTDGCPGGYYKHSLLGCVPIPSFTPETKQQAQIKKSNKPIVKDANYGKKIDPYERIVAKDTEAKQSERNKDLAKRAAISAGIAGAAVTGGAAAPYIMPALNAPLLGTVGTEYGLGALTGSNALGLGFGLSGANKLSKDINTGYYGSDAPTLDKLARGLETGLDVAFSPGVVKGVGVGANAIRSGIANSMESGLLSNTDKINPVGILKDYGFGFLQGGIEQTKGALGELGLLKGTTTRRPFFETFPITKSQKAKVMAMQDEAFADAKKFTEDYWFGNYLNVRPELEEKIRKILPDIKLAKNIDNLEKTHSPFSTTEDLLIPGTFSKKGREGLSEDLIEYLNARRGSISGVNDGDVSITLRNNGLYYKTPRDIANTVVHESAGHTGQKFGYWGESPSTSIGPNDIYSFSKTNWNDLITKYDPNYAYYTSNPDTELGRRFQEALVNPKNKKIGNGYTIQTWRSSPDELHAELMASKYNMYKQGLKQGFSHEEMMRRVTNPGEKELNWLLNNKSINKHFKKTTPLKEKLELLKLLPAVVPAAMIAGAATQQKKEGGPIISTQGYKQGPPPQGSYYRIPSNTLYNPTPYTIKAIANTGQTQILNPFDESSVNFPGAQYVDEIPMAQDGYQLPPIYTSDSKDPRLKPYIDSLILHNSYEVPSKKSSYMIKNNSNDIWFKNQIERFTKKGIKPIAFNLEKVDKDDYHTPIFKKPVQPVIYQKPNPNVPKGWLPLTPEYAKGRYSGSLKNMYYNPTGSAMGDSVITYFPPPEIDKPEPTLKKQVLNVEPIQSSSNTINPQIRIIDHPNIQLPSVQRGEYRTSYYDPGMKDWNERAFMSQEESDKFAQEMSQRGYPGSYGNVTQTRKVNKKYGGLLVDYYAGKMNHGEMFKQGGQTDMVCYDRNGKVRPCGPEDKINKWLGNPMAKAERAAEASGEKWFNPQTKKWESEQMDNFRHPMAGRYTAEGIANKFPNWMQYTPIPKVTGFIGANALGIGHEVMEPNTNPSYSIWDTIREGGEDAFNNMVGAGVGVLPFVSADTKTKWLQYLSDNNMLPDGIGKVDPKRNNGKPNLYKHAMGGNVLKHYYEQAVKQKSGKRNPGKSMVNSEKKIKLEYKLKYKID